MIVVLTGPTGVGKTDTSWALLEMAAPMVFLDCDWFASRVPFSWKLESDVESVYQTLSLMVDYHTRRAADRFVITLTLEMAVSYAQHRKYLDRFGLRLFPFLLLCSADILRERVLKRDRTPVQRSWELDVVPSQLQTCQALSSAFSRVDVSGMDEQAVARRILSSISSAGQSAQQALATDAPQAARR